MSRSRIMRNGKIKENKKISVKFHNRRASFPVVLESRHQGDQFRFRMIVAFSGCCFRRETSQCHRWELACVATVMKPEASTQDGPKVPAEKTEQHKLVSHFVFLVHIHLLFLFFVIHSFFIFTTALHYFNSTRFCAGVGEGSTSGKPAEPSSALLNFL